MVLPLHLFPSILKYPFSPFLISRCFCSRISHQTQKQVRLIPIPCFFLANRLDVHEPLNTQSINRQLPHRFKQAGFHSFHFQRDHRLREERVKSGIPKPVSLVLSKSLRKPHRCVSYGTLVDREWLVSCAHSLPKFDFSLTTRVAKKKVTDRLLAPLVHGLSERSLGNNREWCHGHWLAN